MTRFFRLSLVLVAVLLFASSALKAQTWTKLGYIAGEKIYSLYFFNEYGRPDIALAGTDKALYRSNDAGLTWTKVLNTNGKIQAIRMKDRDHGWVAAGSMTSVVYWTSNTGASWTPVGGITGLADDIEYNPSTGRLFLSVLTGNSGAFVSTNDGISWTKFATTLLNGYAFSSDGKYGLLTPWLGFPLRTSDGGATWTSFDIDPTRDDEIWQPVALRGSKSFCSLDDNSRMFFVSTDAGASWSNRFTFPEAVCGSLEGTACALYAQCKSQMYVTYDLTNWQPIGGPGNLIDTRFQVYQNFVYAGDDTGAVWRYVQPNLPPSNIAVSIDRPAVKDIKAIGCAPDTAWVTIKNIGCDTEIVGSLSIADSSIWKMQRVALPDTLSIGDSIRIRLIATNPHPGSYTSQVDLAWKLQSWSGDTNFTLRYDVTGIRKPTIGPLALNFKDRCSVIDTFVTVRNEQCDSVQLYRASIDDSTVFHLNSGSLPVVLANGQSYKIPVHITAPSKGTYSAKVTVSIHDLGFSLDTVISIAVNVKDAIPFRLPVTYAKDLGRTSICGFKESSIAFTNAACDTITLLSADILSPQLDFSLKNLPTFPTKLAPASSDSVTLHFETRTLGAQQVRVHFQFLLDGVVHDTTFTVTATGAQTLEAAASANSLTFDPINPCGANEQSVYVRNLSCYAVRLTDLQLQTGSRFSIVSPTLPVTIAAGDSVKVIVHLTGSKPIQTFTEQLIATLKDSTQDKVVSVALNGIITPGTRVMRLSTTAISVDSLEACSSFDTVIHVTNLGICDSLEITNISLVGGGSFSVLGSPRTLGENESLDFHLSGSTSSGAVLNGSIHIIGVGIDTNVTFHISVKQGGVPDAALTTATPSFTVRSCQSQALYVRVHNTGCLPLDISSVTINSSGSQYVLGSTWAGSAFTLAPAADTTLTVLFDPTASGDGTASIVLHQADGQTKTIAFTATIIPLHTARVVLTAPNGAVLNPSAGSKTAAHLAFADAIDAADGLTEVRVTLTLDQNFLTVQQITPLNGWSIAPEAGAAGTYQFLATRATPTAISAGDALADLTLGAYVSANMQTDIQLSSLHYMPNDPTYEQCTLAPLSTPVSHVEYSLDPSCGDNTISASLRGDPILSIRSITPNPAGKQDVRIDYGSLNEAGELDIIDITGHSVYRASLAKGSRATLLPTQSLPSGTYHAVIKSGNAADSMPFVIEK